MASTWFLSILGLLLFASFFTVLVLLLKASFHNPPICSINYFYIPALNKSLNSPDNTTLNFMVRYYNPNSNNGIYYDDIHLTFSTANTTNTKTTSSSALVFVANYTEPKFYQGLNKKAKKWGQVWPVNNQTVLRAVLPNGLAVFRLDLKTRVRFKNLFWISKRHGIDVGADVQVNGDGLKAYKKGIEMKKSDSSFPLRSSFPVCVLMNLLVFFVLR